MRSDRAAALACRIGFRMYARPARLSWPDGVVSFTFDDFPKSAFTSGGSILEGYGARGTYYTSMSLAGTQRTVGRMFDHEDICAAHHAGHELACHTHTHLDCCASAKRSILATIRNNAAVLSSVIEGFVPTNFAYPYGRVSPTAKRVLGPRFSSCRGIGGGINSGIIDLANLLAVAVFASDFDEAEMRRLIDHNRSVGGWLIFYTHDVGDVPLPYGCKPAQLEAVVAYASKRTTILPVRDVVRRLRPLEAIPRTVHNAIPRRIHKRWNTLKWLIAGEKQFV
jgi:peptidoglycan/xylan/chitin deacetylase (PgdA/CDA1 family)